MSLLFLDTQTTGMHPSHGHLLEIAWSAEGRERSFLLRLPAESAGVSAKVAAITGIRTEDLAEAVPVEQALQALAVDLDTLGPSPIVIAHYAQFERAFMEASWQRWRGEPFPWSFLCTYQIARRLWPEVPSRNIRALVGYFSLGSCEIRRAGEHVRATRQIWEKLSVALAEQNLHEVPEIRAWLPRAKAPRVASPSFRLDRLRRLALPDTPGVYRMLSREGKVLYVGKATSLRDRVNSYFRGRKGPGPRKRAMLAQVFDLAVTACPSALEAALLESEEIKRLDPPYNVSLKAGIRNLCFFSRDFIRVSAMQDEGHPRGPFVRAESFELLQAWRAGAEAGVFSSVFYEEVPPELLAEGHTIFLNRHGLESLPALRALLALGLRLARQRESRADEGEELEEAPEAEVLSAEDVADRYESLVVRAALEVRRARRLTRLLNCRVHVTAGGRVLEIRGGSLESGSRSKKEFPWAGLGIADYDRMRVLLSETSRLGHRVESVLEAW